MYYYETYDRLAIASIWPVIYRVSTGGNIFKTH